MYFKPPSNLIDNFMPYFEFEVNLIFFEQSTNVLLFILYLSHSSLNFHVMKFKKVSYF